MGAQFQCKTARHRIATNGFSSQPAWTQEHALRSPKILTHAGPLTLSRILHTLLSKGKACLKQRQQTNSKLYPKCNAMQLVAHRVAVESIHFGRRMFQTYGKHDLRADRRSAYRLPLPIRLQCTEALAREAAITKETQCHVH